MSIPSECLAEIRHAQASLTAELKADARRRCGFRAGPTTDASGAATAATLDEAAVLRETYFECYHCGQPWHDDGEFGSTRIGLDASSHYVSARKDALPGNLGFNIPQWINRRLSWGKINLDYLKAKRAAEQGNDMDLRQWWQKTAARVWEENLNKVTYAAVTATIDPLVIKPNELFRYMVIDCQKDKQLSALKGEEMTGHFWVHAGAVDKQGNEEQLWRGYCTSWDEWTDKYKELKIPVVNVGVDGGFKPDEVLKQAALHAELLDERDANGRKTGRQFYGTWTMFRGDDAQTFRWPDGYRRIYSPSQPEQVPLEKNGRTIAIDVNVIRWSNFRVKNILENILRPEPGQRPLTRLPDRSELLTKKTVEMEHGDFSWDSQMAAERLGLDGSGKFARPKWLPLHKQKHYRDCLCMGIVKKLQAGLLGAVAATEEATVRE